MKKAAVYYHRTAYRGEPYTREEILKQQFAGGLRDLILDPAVSQWLITALVRSGRAEEAARVQERRRQPAELERLRARQNMLYEDGLDGRMRRTTGRRKKLANTSYRFRKDTDGQGQ